MNRNITIVTGLWDLGRGGIDGWAKRDFIDYKAKFLELLETDCNMAIWIPKSLENDVWKIRKKENTVLYFKENEEFKTWFPFFNEVQKIRANKSWRNFAGWLDGSPQADLEFYNPVMMSKMFMVHDTTILNPFNSDYYFWIDGGLTNTVPITYFTKENVLDKLDYYCESHNKFVHIIYPYESNEEIHGFERKKMAEYCNTDFVNYVARGGFFGGEKSIIKKLNAIYYDTLLTTLTNGYMGADECIFTILCHNYPNLIHQFKIEGNGLVWPFFEHLKNLDTITNALPKPFGNIKTSLYVISYNSPAQFEKLCLSFEIYDKNFLNKPSKFLLNNSLDHKTDQAYSDICKKYSFTEIKKDNLGICGGRQFIAEHAYENEFDYYFFFEDDMFFYLGNEEFCRNGFRRRIPNFYESMMNVMHHENFDFLKWNFSEFYGDNTKQWAWHNVPQNIRAELFPDNPIKTTNDVNEAPFTKFNNIKNYAGLAYATGEIYYCNWPQTVSKSGNKKMFIDTKWACPYEQTWMSYMYQETVKGNLYPGILLATPTEHDRFEFYPRAERKES